MLKLLIVCILLAFSSLNPAYAHRPDPGGELHFTTAQWAYEVRDENDYDPNPGGGAFPKGQRAYAYLELAGFSLLNVDGGSAYHVLVDVGLQTTWGAGLI